MSLRQRAARLEALAISEAILREREAFWLWLEELSREQRLKFLDYCLPTLVAHNAAPPFTNLPSQMPPEEREAYGEVFQRMAAERRERGGEDAMAEHRIVVDLWRRFVQKASGGSR